MKKKHKWITVTGLVLVCHLSLMACQDQQANHHPKPKQSIKQTTQHEDKTTTVTEITADGYIVTSKGNQKNISGKLPDDAIISEDLYAPKTYVFDQNDVQYETNKGYIVKIGNKYYFYSKDTNKAIPGVTVPTSDGFQLSKDSKILSKTKEGIVVEHDGHSHFIFYSDLKGTPFAYLIPENVKITNKPATTGTSIVGSSNNFSSGDHYIFNPADIVAEDEFGYTVRHEDHYHYIPKTTLTGSHTGPTNNNIPNSPLPVQPTAPATPAQPTAKLGIAGIDYPTSDGFLFNGTGMQGWTNLGLLVNHNGHTHILLKSDLAASKWAYLLPQDHLNSTPQPAIPSLSDTMAKKRQELADQLGIPVEKIRVVIANNQVIGFEYPHDDHYDMVPVTEEDSTNHSKPLTEQEKKELTAYIRKTYGLIMGTPVRFDDSFAYFAIPHPHQDYDPKRDYYDDTLDPIYDKGHVHPYAVPLNRLEIPKQTGIPELDYENELIAFSKRSGIPVNQIQVKDNKYFVLPGKDHDHYINILSSPEARKAYKDNSLPSIKPHLSVGAFSKDSVETEIARVQESAKTILGEDTVEYRRILRALDEYRSEISTGARSSTQAYLDALKSFENTYVLKQENTSANNNSIANPLEEKADQLIDRTKALGEKKASSYGTTVETLVNKLKTAVQSNDTLALSQVEDYLNAIERTEAAPNDQLPRVAYMDFFLRHVDSPYLSPELRESVSQKILALKEAGRKTDYRTTLADTVELKKQVKEALTAAEPQTISIGEAYTTLNKNKAELVGHVNHWAGIFNYAITEEEKKEGFDRNLQVLPAIKPTNTSNTSQPTTPNKPETSTTPTNPNTDNQQQNPQKPLTIAEQQVALQTWLAKLTPQVTRTYKIDVPQWTTDISSQDPERLNTLSSHMTAINRVEEQQTHAGARIAYLDFFLRHIDQPYIDYDLREQLATKSVQIPSYSKRDFKQNLTEIVDLKNNTKAAIEEQNTPSQTTGPAYQAFLEEKSKLIELVNTTKDYLLGRNYITSEELSEGFGKPYTPPLTTSSSSEEQIENESENTNTEANDNNTSNSVDSEKQEEKPTLTASDNSQTTPSETSTQP